MGENRSRYRRAWRTIITRAFKEGTGLARRRHGAQTVPSLHRVFDSYAAAALSITAHGALAVLVLWSGARLFNSTTAMAETRPVIDWVPLPGTNSPGRAAGQTARPTTTTSGPERLKGTSVRIPLGPAHPALHVPPPVP